MPYVPLQPYAQISQEQHIARQVRKSKMQKKRGKQTVILAVIQNIGRYHRSVPHHIEAVLRGAVPLQVSEGQNIGRQKQPGNDRNKRSPFSVFLHQTVRSFPVRLMSG